VGGVMDAVATAQPDHGYRQDVGSHGDKPGYIVGDLHALVAAGKKYRVITADPAWNFKTYSDKGQKRSAERHYRTMPIGEIKALPVADLAAEHAVLFLWIVQPRLHQALEIISAWGFTFKTVAFAWIKTTRDASLVELDGSGLHWGMGYWTRANIELCLLATRGKPKRADKGVHQVVIAPVSEHSRKPDKVQVAIEQLLGEPSRDDYLELFARRATAGWTVWGDQVERTLFTHTIEDFPADRIMTTEP
jgi:N6-adenosine-specific RNA methylase IME4